MTVEQNNPTLDKISTDDWYKNELSSTQLGDKRLDKRLVQVASALSLKPSAPINQACADWHATKAAYNFFDNEKVSPEKILQPHVENTVGRIGNHKTILAIQDTSTINYGSHHAVELGHIGKSDTNGLMQHNTLALTTNGLPLGLLDQKCWSRPITPDEKAKQNRISIEEKESSKWLDALKATESLCPASTKAVTICDREADIYEFFDQAESLNASILVRLRHDREIEESPSGIKSYVQSQTIAAECSIEVSKKKGEYEQRTATVVVRHAAVTLEAPEKILDEVKHEAIKMHIIHVQEINAPEGVNPVEWYLLTNLSISSTKEALEKIDWYKLRWMVEIFHKTEKTCCAVEDCRLTTAHRLMRFLALKSIIAWRIMFMTYINRQNPKGPAESVLAPTEIKVLETVIEKRTRKPKKIRTVNQAIKAIASLGGYLNRKSDKDPGIITICRGIQRLHDFTEGFIFAKIAFKKA